MLLTLFLIEGCTLSRTLEDGRTKVPRNANFFQKKFRDKYDVRPPEGVDVTALYYVAYSISDQGVKKYAYGNPDAYGYGGYRFFSNGAVMQFGADQMTPLDSINLDPNYGCRRGVFYMNDGRCTLSMYTQVSGTCNSYGLVNNLAYPKVEGDSLVRRWDNGYTTVYKKHPLQPHQIFQADW